MNEKTPLHFITGRAGSGKSTAVLDGIRASLSAGRRVFLIVPEQQAVVWESRAARALPADAALRLEIVNFTRLANLVSRTVGGLSYRYITKGGKAALMWSALRTLSPTLSFYGGEKRMDRAVPALLAASSEMKRAGVSPADLMRAAETLSEDPDCARISARAKDLAMLTAAYGEMLRVSYDDDEDELAHLAERLSDTDFFADSDVFVDSFFSLTPVESEILYHIFRQAHGVTVTFACPPTGGEEAPLAAPKKFLAAMQRAADRAKRAYAITHLHENRRAQAASLRHLEAHLWDFTAPPLTDSEADGAVRVILSADRYAEAEAAACRIAELVRAGAKYGDIAVIARSIDPLRGILDTALTNHNIPYFLSARADIDKQPAARLMTHALAVAAGGWRKEDVLLVAKTGLASLTDDECDALEAYTETWHIRGEKAFSNPWNMNPDGYVPTVSKRGQKVLALANDAREKLIPPLCEFCSVFRKGSASVPEISRAMYELLCAYGVWDSLDAQAKAAAQTDHRKASELAQMWGILMDCLDTLARTLPDAQADAAAYSALLRQVLASAHVGAIPGGVDEVVIGEANQVRLGEIAHVILLDAVEGEFPGTPSDDGFFSDTDRIRLEGAGVVLSGTSDDRMKEELFWFYRAVSLPHETLTVLLPEKDGSKVLFPSMGTERILALLPQVKKERFDTLPLPARIFSGASAQAAIREADEITAAALSALGFVPMPHADLPIGAEGESVSPETAAMLFPREISLTQSKLDTFVQCRFGYYCKYIARLEEEKSARFAANSVGTFIHRIFELFFERLGDRPLPRPAEELRDITDGLVETCITEIVPDSGISARTKHLFVRLRQCVLPMLSALSAEFAQSKFRPIRFELNIGTEVPSLGIPLSDGHTVSLRGNVDRLDTWNDGENTYVRVVDYKTGSKEFFEADIAIGLNVQLLLYLFSILHMPKGAERDALFGETGELLPAGALYFSARPGETKSDTYLAQDDAALLAESSIKKDGILLSDERVLTAMDAEISGRFIPVKRKKSGFEGKVLRTAEEIAAIEQTMCDAIRRQGETMLSGDAATADPEDPRNIKDSPCKFCKLNAVCRASLAKGDH